MLKLKNMKRSSKGGFTLVELLVVIGIILVLAGLALPAIQNALTSAEKAGIKRNTQILNSSYGAYLAAGGTTQTGYTTAVAALQANEIPNTIIGVGGPFLLSTPTRTATIGGITSTIEFSTGKNAFYIDSTDATLGGYGS